LRNEWRVEIEAGVTFHVRKSPLFVDFELMRIGGERNVGVGFKFDF
jgi:hypothetical protein